MSKIDPRASIAPTARLGNCVTIDAFAVIGDEVELGEGCIVESTRNGTRALRAWTAPEPPLHRSA